MWGVGRMSTATAGLDPLAEAMAQAHSADADRYTDPLSVPALAWSLQHGDHAGRWLWHAGSLYRYSSGVYKRDGAEWAAARLREILVAAADRMTADAAERCAGAGQAWREATEAMNLIHRIIGLPDSTLAAAEKKKLWPTPETTRQAVEARYTKPKLIDPTLLALTADVRLATEGAAVDADIDTLNLTNGLLDVRTMALRPHDPDHLSTIQLPVAYDPDANCPRFGRFLDEVLPPDAIPVVVEMLGYLLTADTRQHKAFLLLGGGSNGKSVLLDVIRALLGAENCAATPLQALGEERFAPATLVGKLANLCADLPAATQKDTSTFKEVVAGDRLKAEEKFRPPFDFTPFARLVFSANEAPGTTDASHGYWRRWVTIPFPARYAEPDEVAALAAGARVLDRGLTARLLAELPGILNLALVGLARLRAQGGFTKAESCEMALQQYRERADSVAGFVAESCDMTPGCTVGRTTLYVAYRDWCLQSGREPLGRNRFCERIDATPGITEERDDSRSRCWGGIRLRPHEVREVPGRAGRAGGWAQ